MVLKFDGWDLISTKNGRFSIFYEPGVIGDTGGMIYISEEVYNQAKEGNIDLTSLFEMYNLYESQHIIKSSKVISSNKSALNTASKFHGKGFIVINESGKYFIKYQLARHGGGVRKFEISKEVYEDARTGNYTTNELFKKYDLYHLDVPENDIE